MQVKINLSVKQFDFVLRKVIIPRSMYIRIYYSWKIEFCNGASKIRADFGAYNTVKYIFASC